MYPAKSRNAVAYKILVSGIRAKSAIEMIKYVSSALSGFDVILTVFKPFSHSFFHIQFLSLSLQLNPQTSTKTHSGDHVAGDSRRVGDLRRIVEVLLAFEMKK